MSMKKIIIANWKMNPQILDEALRLAKGLLARSLPKNAEIVIAPPFVYLELLKKNCGKEIKLAGQNISFAERGAFTGEISGLMLKNLGCDYVIVGHSERRYKMGETDEMINLKIKEALKSRLTPILAVGEREKDDDIIQILTKQIRGALGGVEASEMSRLIIAYEPVWAISRPSADIASALSQTASQCPDTPDHALSAALLIKKIIGNLYGADWATNLPVLYGGSGSEENASDFISQSGINGALVGAASLELEKFVKIIKAAEINE